MKRPARSVMLLALAALALTGCRAERGDEPGPMRLPQPVELVLDAQGRPDPSILAETQELHRGNGEEPQTRPTVGWCRVRPGAGTSAATA